MLVPKKKNHMIRIMTAVGQSKPQIYETMEVQKKHPKNFKIFGFQKIKNPVGWYLTFDIGDPNAGI